MKLDRTNLDDSGQVFGEESTDNLNPTTPKKQPQIKIPSRTSFRPETSSSKKQQNSPKTEVDMLEQKNRLDTVQSNYLTSGQSEPPEDSLLKTVKN
jgi:hypothetical protein